MYKKYKDSFAEVDEIFKIMPIELLTKIPTEIRKCISENKTLNYSIDIYEPIELNKLKDETISVLGYLYREYIAIPEEREKLKNADDKYLESVINEGISVEMVEYKSIGFFRKLTNYFKYLFNKNKI